MSLSTLIGNITSQALAIGRVIPAIQTLQIKKREINNEAITSMRKALNRTRIFLNDPDFTNIKELSEISELWNDASGKVGIVNPELGQTLGNKSRFWSDHELFISLGKDKEIISLLDVTSEIDRLYLSMK